VTLVDGTETLAYRFTNLQESLMPVPFDPALAGCGFAAGRS